MLIKKVKKEQMTKEDIRIHLQFRPLPIKTLQNLALKVLSAVETRL
jgi:hypothetical protein